MPRRSFSPDWQTVGVPACSSGPRFRPRWVQRSIRFQRWHIFPLCEKRRVPLQHLSRGRTQWRMIRPEGIWPSRPSIETCRSAMGWVLDHRASFRLCGTTRLALLSRGYSDWHPHLKHVSMLFLQRLISRHVITVTYLLTWCLIDRWCVGGWEAPAKRRH